MRFSIRAVRLALSPEFWGTARDVAHPILRILSGVGASQLIAFAVLPFITRLYSPSEYGLFGALLAIVAVVVVVTTLQLHNAIVIPRLDSRALELFKLSCLGSLIGGALTAAVATIPGVIAEGSAPWFPVLLGLAVASAAIAQTVQGLAIRQRKFGRIGLAALARVCVVAGVQLSLGALGAGVSGLLLGYIVGEVAASLLLATRGYWGDERHHPMTFVRARALIRRYKDFALFGTAQEGMNALSQGVPVVILGASFGPAVAGAYNLAMRVLLAPAQLLGGAMRQVLSQRFSRMVSDRQLLKSEFRALTLGTAVPALLVALTLAPALPALFALVFGSSWRLAGEFSSWLAIWAVFGIFNVPASVIMRVTRRQRENFLLNAAVLATRLLCLVWGALQWDPKSTIVALAALGVLWNTVLIIMAGRYVDAPAKGIA